MNAFTSEQAEKLVTKGSGGSGIHGAGGYMRHGKSRNSAGHSNGARRQRSIAALKGHLERHPSDKQSETHLASLTT